MWAILCALTLRIMDEVNGWEVENLWFLLFLVLLSNKINNNAHFNGTQMQNLGAVSVHRLHQRYRKDFHGLFHLLLVFASFLASGVFHLQVSSWESLRLNKWSSTTNLNLMFYTSSDQLKHLLSTFCHLPLNPNHCHSSHLHLCPERTEELQRGSNQEQREIQYLLQTYIFFLN